MAIPDDIDAEKLAEAALAILCLTAFQDDPVMRAWKGMDWDLMDMLYERGWIRDPKGKAKSVVLTEEGLAKAEHFLQRHFAKDAV
ncbi:MAG: hypothetical protein KF886_09215 [Candidatus Hydrogenedentes bacterium]|nr:hypothetical protein [Candidatus Hydrogenedentota bacterium]